jgi:hypothetical protein
MFTGSNFGMPKYQIPKSAGEFHVVTAKAGNPLITNNKTGKGKVLIPCRDWVHADEILEKLKDYKKGGELWV